MEKGTSYTEHALLAVRGRPVSLGRYSLRRKLGAGASSTVWAAHDPESGREVVVTLILSLGSHHDGRAEQAEQARRWEAVDHLNVARVCETGTFMDPRDESRRLTGVFIVREMVPGVALHRWLDTLSPITADRVLEVFCAAGRGLAAAHHAGLVHGDFESSSVVVGFDGVPRVVGFAAPGAPSQRRSSDGLAPELLTGATVDARADQYGFCAVLRTAFSRPELRASRRLLETLDRGLSPRPEDRWPSMEALVRALERSRSGWFRAVSTILGNRATGKKVPRAPGSSATAAAFRP